MSAKYKHPGNTKAGRYERKMRAMKRRNKSAGCYVATCIYGSYDCPEVWTLRRYRDRKLLKTRFGRAFVRCYYAVSPKIIEMFGGNRLFHSICRVLLDRAVQNLKKHGYSADPYLDEE